MSGPVDAFLDIFNQYPRALDDSFLIGAIIDGFPLAYKGVAHFPRRNLTLRKWDFNAISGQAVSAFVRSKTAACCQCKA